MLHKISKAIVKEALENNSMIVLKTSKEHGETQAGLSYTPNTGTPLTAPRTRYDERLSPEKPRISRL